MALVIEATDESGSCGLPVISVCHYGEQNGDLMRDPRRCVSILGWREGRTLNPKLPRKRKPPSHCTLF